MPFFFFLRTANTPLLALWGESCYGAGLFTPHNHRSHNPQVSTKWLIANLLVSSNFFPSRAPALGALKEQQTVNTTSILAAWRGFAAWYYHSINLSVQAVSYASPVLSRYAALLTSLSAPSYLGFEVSALTTMRKHTQRLNENLRVILSNPTPLDSCIHVFSDVGVHHQFLQHLAYYNFFSVGVAPLSLAKTHLTYPIPVGYFSLTTELFFLNMLRCVRPTSSERF